MRALSLFTFAVAVLGGVAALTVPFKRSDFDSVDVREIREPATSASAQHAVPNPIKFSKGPGAKKHMDNLGLAEGSPERKPAEDSSYHRKIEEELEVREPAKNAIRFSKAAKEKMTSLGLAKGSNERKQVKEYHRNIIAAEMAKHGAVTARVVQLGHSSGEDKRYHVTAALYNHEDHEGEKKKKKILTNLGTPTDPRMSDLHHIYADKADAHPIYRDAVKKAGETL